VFYRSVIGHLEVRQDTIDECVDADFSLDAAFDFIENLCCLCSFILLTYIVLLAIDQLTRVLLLELLQTCIHSKLMNPRLNLVELILQIATRTLTCP
jgi:hypothetical protein